jgi:hypothetical protein
MPISVVCGTCASNLKAPDSAAGRGVKCPKCSAQLTVPSSSELPNNRPVVAVQPNPTQDRPSQARPARPAPERPSQAQPAKLVAAPVPQGESQRDSSYGNAEDGVKDCPFCGEEVRAKARKCKHCGETLDVTLRAAEESKREAKRESRRESNRVDVRQNVYVDVGRRDLPQKSMALALILSFLFGPLGMLYSTVLGAIVMFLVNLILIFPTAGLITFVTWPVGMIWSCMAVSSHNNRR